MDKKEEEEEEEENKNKSNKLKQEQQQQQQQQQRTCVMYSSMFSMVTSSFSLSSLCLDATGPRRSPSSVFRESRSSLSGSGAERQGFQMRVEVRVCVRVCREVGSVVEPRVAWDELCLCVCVLQGTYLQVGRLSLQRRYARR